MNAGSTPDNSTELFAVIAAAGVGSRMNLSTPKQYVEIDGQAVIVRTVNRLLKISALQKLIIVAESSTIDSCSKLPFTDSSRLVFCEGGNSRAQSVLNGLVAIKPSNANKARVLVHDAARPCVRITDVQHLIEQTNDEHGGLLAMRVSDTIKSADQHQRVVSTVDRESLWRAATPQIFNYQLLLNALDNAVQQGLPITDEASAMQHAGYKPKLMECHSDNIKITTATDLALAAHFLAAQRTEGNQI